MPLRLLHLADLHLDRAFAGMGCHGDLARRRRQGLRDALRRAGGEAQRRDCQVITIGGDLYEHERAGPDTGRFLAETFAAWRPMRVVLAAGNHDALLPGSLYARTEWPDNVHLLILMVTWGFFNSAATYGADQDMAQRLLACRDPRKARWM